MSAQEKREVILQALEKVLREKRLDEVTVDQVAEEAGIGKGTVYRYFEDKEDLFFQMVQDLLMQESDDVSLVAASVMEPREKLIRIGETMSDHILRKGQFLRLLLAQGKLHGKQHRDPRQMMKEHHKRLDRILTQVFSDAGKAGLIRPDIDPDCLVCLFKGGIFQRSIRIMHENHKIPLGKLLDLILAGAGVGT